MTNQTLLIYGKLDVTNLDPTITMTDADGDEVFKARISQEEHKMYFNVEGGEEQNKVAL